MGKESLVGRRRKGRGHFRAVQGKAQHSYSREKTSWMSSRERAF
jgi:hypothetical protein